MNVLDRLDEEERKEFWAGLALKHCPELSPRFLAKILRHYGSAYQAYSAIIDLRSVNIGLAGFDFFARKIPSQIVYALRGGGWREKAQNEWQEAQKTDCDVVLWTDYRYPLALKRIVDAPPFFYAKGNIGLLSCPGLAIVGSRKFHPQSLKKARQIARELSSVGITVVSGMALGIDQAAHGAALLEKGKTVAVLGTGINVIYPKQHKDLYYAIAEQGLVISEFSPFMPAHAQNFPIRNRLISGISEGVLIVEAELKSGSLITARLALEQNKNVYVCRPEHELHSLGCQKLIEEGALCIEDSRAILADMVPYLMNEYETMLARQEKNAAVSAEKTGENSVAAEFASKPVSDSKPEKIYTARPIVNRPKETENLALLPVDFGGLARDILEKHSEPLVPFERKTKEKKPKKTVSENVSEKQNGISEKSKQNAEAKESGNPVLWLIAENGALTADEIMLLLKRDFRKETDMAELSSELLLLEIDGKISRAAGGRYVLG